VSARSEEVQYDGDEERWEGFIANTDCEIAYCHRGSYSIAYGSFAASDCWTYSDQSFLYFAYAQILEASIAMRLS